jgi:hypothetical protein
MRPTAPSIHVADSHRLRDGKEVTTNFVVVPVGRNPIFGFWVRANDAEEARRLVALNVPEMAGVTDPNRAQCGPDETYAPIHGAIFEGSGRSYTITRRKRKVPNGPVAP